MPTYKTKWVTDENAFLKLRAIQECFGFSSEDMASMAGCSRGAYTDYFRRREIPEAKYFAVLFSVRTKLSKMPSDEVKEIVRSYANKMKYMRHAAISLYYDRKKEEDDGDCIV